MNSEAQLFDACKNGHCDIVKLILNDGRVNPAAKNNYAIQLAATTGHCKTVQARLISYLQ